MENTEIGKLLHPSVMQIRYLMELEKIGKDRGNVTAVASSCGVSHGPVSRFFKECVESGYLTENYAFTETGKNALTIYKRIFLEVEAYLRNIEIPEQDIPERFRQLVENVDYELLLVMTKNARQEKKSRNAKDENEDQPYFLEEVLENGVFNVGIAIHQINNHTGTDLSMAYRGFEHIALVRNNTRGQWLELVIKEMQARSRIDGAEMQGHLSSLKYEKQGKLYEAKIRDGRLRIPLEACRFVRSARGNVKGIIPITVTCSVGEAHMPESTALLSFWL